MQNFIQNAHLGHLFIRIKVSQNNVKAFMLFIREDGSKNRNQIRLDTGTNSD